MAVTTKVRFLRLRQELREGHNPEINTDKQELVSRMGQLGFRPEITEALEEVDRKLTAAGTAFDFKGCMDLARTTYEELVEDAAKTAAGATGAPLPDSSKPFKPWRELLVKTGALTAEDGEWVQALYNYLSNAGAHKLGSAVEQVRVTRNSIIEVGLMVVGRVQALKASAPRP